MLIITPSFLLYRADWRGVKGVKAKFRPSLLRILASWLTPNFTSSEPYSLNSKNSSVSEWLEPMIKTSNSNLSMPPSVSGRIAQTLIHSLTTRNWVFFAPSSFDLRVSFHCLQAVPYAESIVGIDVSGISSFVHFPRGWITPLRPNTLKHLDHSIPGHSFLRHEYHRLSNQAG